MLPKYRLITTSTALSFKYPSPKSKFKLFEGILEWNKNILNSPC